MRIFVSHIINACIGCEWTPVIGLSRCPWTQTPLNCFGQDRDSCSFYTSGQCFQGGVSTSGNDRWGNKDVVGMEVDMDKRRVLFFVKNQRQRVIYTHIPECVQVGVAMDKAGATAEILRYERVKESSFVPFWRDKTVMWV
ncbi:uncharacterized protein MONOS_17066 [Monocercomonoides exilis]|uniref:uncharacterized protein n=1 Tax=Monocercomonoides exilis TaxID=2049356 RepID=UPI00355945E1|nr:hypothetical protein MONOS_17066 [Monocercomonoides exilis]